MSITTLIENKSNMFLKPMCSFIQLQVKIFTNSTVGAHGERMQSLRLCYEDIAMKLEATSNFGRDAICEPHRLGEFLTKLTVVEVSDDKIILASPFGCTVTLTEKKPS